MTWIQSHSLELLALLLYTALMVYHAWVGNRQTRSLADYFVGGRSIGGATVGISFFATYASTNSFVGFSGQGYDLRSCLVAAGAVCCWLQLHLLGLDRSAIA